MLKSIGKSKPIWLIFATEEVIPNREKVPNILNISNITNIRAIIAKKLKTTLKKNKKQKNYDNNQGYNNFNQSCLYNKNLNNYSYFPQFDSIIYQQSATFVLDIAVYYTILARAILLYAKILI